MPELKTQNGTVLSGEVLPLRSLDAQCQTLWDDWNSSQPHLGSPFLSRTYCNAVDAVRPGVRVCIIRRGGVPQAFMPFQFATLGHKLIGSAERVGGEMTDHFGLIATPGFRLDGSSLLKLAGLSSLYFTHLPESQEAYGLTGVTPEPALQIRLGGGAKEYWDEIVPQNKKFHSELRRVRNGLEKKTGPLRFTVREENPLPALEHLIAQKQAQYERTSREDPLAKSWAIQLLRVLATETRPDCAGIVSTFYAGDMWISSHFGILGNGTLQYWFPVYNPEFRSFKPGYLLLQSIINEAQTLGINTIDRGAGDTLAKRLFANAEYTLSRGIWTRGNLRSLAYRVGCSLKWRMQGTHATAGTE